MKQYHKPALTRLSWRDGYSKYQCLAFFKSIVYKMSLAPGERWEDDE